MTHRDEDPDPAPAESRGTQPRYENSTGTLPQICRYLALEPDPGSIALFACEEHRCFRAGEPLAVALGYQDEVCLREAHGRCPRFLDAQTPVPIQPRRRLRRWPWSQR